jgi:hypothetical protein
LRLYAASFSCTATAAALIWMPKQNDQKRCPDTSFLERVDCNRAHHRESLCICAAVPRHMWPTRMPDRACACSVYSCLTGSQLSGSRANPVVWPRGHPGQRNPALLPVPR